MVSPYGLTRTVVFYAMQLYFILSGYGCILKHVNVLHEVFDLGAKSNDNFFFLPELALSAEECSWQSTRFRGKIS